MDVWRISNYADLSGTGGRLAGGRWHTAGKPVVYLADHPGSALLEILVHMDRSVIPATYRLLRVHLPSSVAIHHVDASKLPAKWRQRPDRTRDIGDAWLDKSTSAILSVPSAIVPGARNYLLNPAHLDATAIRIEEIIDAPFDERLFATTS